MDKHIVKNESTGRVLVDVAGLSAQLGLSVSSIYRRRSLGLPLPRAMRIGAHVRWTQASIDEWITAQMEPNND